MVACGTANGGERTVQPRPLLVETSVQSSAPVALAAGSVSRTSVPPLPATFVASSVRRVPTRIVSLSPTATETLFALGAGPAVTAVDQGSSYPPSAPRTSLTVQDPDVTAVLALMPDLVVTESPNAALTTALTAHRIEQLVGPPAVTLQDSYDQIHRLGVATGHAAAADQIVASMQASVSAIVAKTPAGSATKWYYHERDDRYTTITSTSYLGQLYGLLHLQSIADGGDSTPSGSRQLSASAVAAANPDFVFLADAKCCRQSIDTVRARPGWSDMKAVNATAVLALDDDLASRWGPRIVDLLQAVSNRLSALSVH